MSNVLTGVKDKIGKLLVNYDGRWDDTKLTNAIRLADLAIREECEIEWASTDVTMIDQSIYYVVPEDVVTIGSVIFSYDGTDFDRPLDPVTFADLDEHSVSWGDDTGTAPDLYSLLSTPGVNGYSKILFWRPISTVSGEKVRINYIKCNDTSAKLTAATAPEWVQIAVYVPYVMSLLLAEVDPVLAMQYMDEYRANVPEVANRYNVRFTERETQIARVP